MFFDDGDEAVDRDGNPNLRLHRGFRGAVELLEPQMLLDPLEEEFHLPAAFVQGADGGGRKGEVVDDEHQRLAGLGMTQEQCATELGFRDCRQINNYEKGDSEIPRYVWLANVGFDSLADPINLAAGIEVLADNQCH